MMSVGMMVAVVYAENVAVVGGAAGCVGEDGVGLGEEGEGVRSVWVGGICIWMVSFGEGVEGLFNLGRCRVVPHIQPLIMILARNLIMATSSLL